MSNLYKAPPRQESRRAHLLRGVQPLALFHSVPDPIPCTVIDRVGVLAPIMYDLETKQPTAVVGTMYVPNLLKRERDAAAIAAQLAVLANIQGHEATVISVDEADAL
jgi:hypothetical protein